MPRRRKAQPTQEPTGPIPISEVIADVRDRFPTLTTASELPSQPEHTPDSPPFEPTAPRPKSWGETVRPWESYPTAGIERVEVKSPDMTGVRFADDRRRTTDEKAEMEAAGLRFFTRPQAWLEKANPEARDRTKALARSFAERRRVEDQREFDR